MKKYQADLERQTPAPAILTETKLNEITQALFTVVQRLDEFSLMQQPSRVGLGANELLIVLATQLDDALDRFARSRGSPAFDVSKHEAIKPLIEANTALALDVKRLVARVRELETAKKPPERRHRHTRTERTTIEIQTTTGCGGSGEARRAA